MKDTRKSFFGGLFSLTELAAGVAFAVLCGAVSLQVISRYVTGYSFGWAEELPIFLFFWTCFLAAAAAYREDRHLGVTLLYARFPAGIRRVLDYLNLILTFLLFLFIFYHELDVATSVSSTFVIMKFSKTYQYIGIPIACAIFMIFVIEKLIKKIRSDLRSGRGE